MSTCKRGLRSSLPGLLVAVAAVWAGTGDMPLAAQQSTQSQSVQPTQGWIPIDASKGAGSPAAPTMPSMPAVSTPSIGSGFYVPGSDGFYAPTLPRRSTTSSSSNAGSTQTGTATTATGTTINAGVVTQNTTAPQSATTQTNQTAATLQNLSLAASTQSANQLSSILSAGDLNSLQSGGYIGSFSSLLGANSNLLGATNTVNAATAAARANDSAMLQQILTELTQIKQEVATQKTVANAAAGTSAGTGKGSLGTDIIQGTTTAAVARTASTAQATAAPRILRFLVNSYDVLPSCKQLYFSTQESDGSFLMTGDRKYNADGKLRTETFYLLFRATGSKSGSTSYNVVPSLSQDYENQNSFLYQLATRNSLTATRTGNLVTMHIADGSWNCDLLLTMDN